MPTRPTQTGPARALLGAAILGLAAIAGATGCATYANYPPIGQDLAVNDPNVVPLPVLMRVATARVLQRDANSGDLPANWVLNLPRGMTPERARSVLDNTMPDAGVTGGMLVGDEGFRGLPVYSVTRVWLRGSKATVDVIRPVTLDGMQPTDENADGVAYTYQKVTLRLEGGFRPWRVANTREWPIGREQRPELFGWPEPAAPAETETESEPPADTESEDN